MLNSIKNVSKENLEKYKILVHGIRGASFGIYAEAAAKKADELEQAAKNGDFNYVKNNNSNFIEDVSKLLDNIDAFFSTVQDESIQDESQKPIKEKPDDELMAKLLEACENFDIDEAQAVLLEIEKYQYKSDKNFTHWLRENIEMLNFSAIIEKYT